MMVVILRVSVVVIMAALLTGCGEEYVWNQKMTVVVETPNGSVSSSSVSQVKLVDVRGMPADGRRVNSFLTGEAVVLPLGNGRYLFALLKGLPQLNWLVYPGVDAAEAGKRLQAGEEGSKADVPVPSERYPVFVTFGDVNDPISVKRVDPSNLETAFGPGYRLNSLTLGLTTEPLTNGKVEEVLVWLPTANFIIPPDQQPRYVKDQTFEQKLMPSDFIDGSTLKLLREKEAKK